MDISYLLFLQNIREATGGACNGFFDLISQIAVGIYLSVPLLVLFWTVDKKKASSVLLGLGSALWLNAFLKLTFCVYRPWIRSAQVKPVESALAGATGYSFPSGHSTWAGSVYGGLIAVYRKHRSLCWFFGVMMVLTMLSRNYLGVHTPQDVIVGAGSSALTAFAVCALMRWVEKNPEKDWMLLAAAAVMCAAVLIYINVKSYPMDYVDGQLLVDPQVMMHNGFKDPGTFFGIVLGWFAERRLVRFDEKAGTTVQKMTRALFGGLLFIAYHAIAIPAICRLSDAGIVTFAAQASEMVIFMTIYPYLAEKLQK